MATKQATAAPTRSHLSLKGSTAIVHEFFSYSLQSILYQRELYPPEDFKAVKKYGLQILVATDEELQEYLEKSMAQIKQWLEQGSIERLVVAIIEKGSGEVRERWQFDVQVTAKGTDEAQDGKENVNPVASSAPVTTKGKKEGKQKTDADVRAEIAAIIKQITASCTFLPLLDEECAFQILAYTKSTAPVPDEWVISSPQLIDEKKAEQVRLRSFSTAVHRVEAMVAYRRDVEDEDGE
ncbi:DNA-binding protein [Tilletiaria anomala UBC 951]|uniref:DNA-binding protein n=1 Tax=Tilletiaria anomala (strain ATCC 24038 / CBS 436.72 / UBC 951) TaxID=1037660 RepID=A0A066VW56_TILAU|nr:DNA-binding protein [Tilletiaria anomala UBC 951]KDN44518.1 DNA-binding protein [Tilletiaria anomala UBC 951]